MSCVVFVSIILKTCSFLFYSKQLPIGYFSLAASPDHLKLYKFKHTFYLNVLISVYGLGRPSRHVYVCYHSDRCGRPLTVWRDCARHEAYYTIRKVSLKLVSFEVVSTNAVTACTISMYWWLTYPSIQNGAPITRRERVKMQD